MTGEKELKSGKRYTTDWLVRGVLTKLGEMFDRFTGRSWNPSSSLATSKLIEKLKALLDSEVRDLGPDGRFVPHDLKLMIQWDKFSTDSDKDIGKLENELHAAAIDHINDRLYHTYAPVRIEIKTDYFTQGVRLLSNFGNFAETEDDEAAINVTLPNLGPLESDRDGKISVVLNREEILENQSKFIAGFVENAEPREVELDFSSNSRMSVGRSAENDLSIDDRSISKIHASLVLNSDRRLLVADTGSTNGTFIDGERIAYGKAVEVGDGAVVRFGSVDVSLERLEGLGPTAGETIAEGAADAELTAAFSDPPPATADSAPGEAAVAEDAPADVHPAGKTIGTESSDIGSVSPPDEENAGKSDLDRTQDWEI